MVDIDNALPLACKIYVGGVPFFANGKKVMAPDLAKHVQAAMPTAFLAGVHLPSVRLLPWPWSHEPDRAEFCKHLELAINRLVGLLAQSQHPASLARCSPVDLQTDARLRHADSCA